VIYLKTKVYESEYTSKKKTSYVEVEPEMKTASSETVKKIETPDMACVRLCMLRIIEIAVML
jgi:hypothetical protein